MQSQHLILLDGPKGAGKTTVRRLLCNQLPAVVALSLDKARVLLPVQPGESMTEANARATDALRKQLRAALGEGRSVLIDSGLSKERLASFEAIAKELGVSVFKYQLEAPLNVLLERVQQRDAAKDKQTDIERFHETYVAWQKKGSEGFRRFDTSVLSPDAIVKEILADLAI